MFKVNNRNTRTRCEICLKLTVKIQEPGTPLKVVLFLSETLQTTRPDHHLLPIELKTFKDSELCVVAHLKQYIKMTAPFRNTGTSHLLLSFVQPHKPISTTTLSRWCVTVMKECGINISGSHSNRSTSTSKCKISGLSFQEILKSAGWSNEKNLHNFMIGQFKRTP